MVASVPVPLDHGRVERGDNLGLLEHAEAGLGHGPGAKLILWLTVIFARAGQTGRVQGEGGAGGQDGTLASLLPPPVGRDGVARGFGAAHKTHGLSLEGGGVLRADAGLSGGVLNSDQDGGVTLELLPLPVGRVDGVGGAAGVSPVVHSRGV